MYTLEFSDYNPSFSGYTDYKIEYLTLLGAVRQARKLSYTSVCDPIIYCMFNGKLHFVSY